MTQHEVLTPLTDDEFDVLRDSLNIEYETEVDEGQVGDGYFTENIPSLESVVGFIVDGVDYTKRLTKSQWERVHKMYEYSYGE